MAKYPIAVVVNFCTNEKRFLKECLEQALLFSPQVIISVCDHFFDGVPENRALLEEIYAAFPACHFVEYPYIPNLIPKRIFKSVDIAHFWHSLSRLLGYEFVDDRMESVLFLDADEVPDGRRFLNWLESSDYQHQTVLKMANYWYFRHPNFRAEQWEDSIVLAHKTSLVPHLLLEEEEREAIYHSLPGPKRRRVVGVDGTPMFHHYSWVRTKDEMLKKVRSWGHKKDRDWETLVHEAFASNSDPVDFVHGYRLETVSPPFQIHMGETLFPRKGPPSISRLSPEEVLAAISKGKRPWWKTFFQA